MAFKKQLVADWLATQPGMEGAPAQGGAAADTIAAGGAGGAVHVRGRSGGRGAGDREAPDPLSPAGKVPLVRHTHVALALEGDDAPGGDKGKGGGGQAEANSQGGSDSEGGTSAVGGGGGPWKGGGPAHWGWQQPERCAGLLQTMHPLHPLPLFGHLSSSLTAAPRARTPTPQTSRWVEGGAGGGTL